MSASIPVATGSSITRKQVIRFSHLWTVEDFSFFLNDGVISSPPFSSNANDGLRWRLELYPEGSEGVGKDHVSIYLKLLSCKDCEALVKCKFSVAGVGQRPIDSRVPREPIRMAEGSSWGFAHFVARDFLLSNSESYFPDDRLTVYCEISYALHIPVQDLPSEITRDQPRERADELVDRHEMSLGRLALDSEEFDTASEVSVGPRFAAASSLSQRVDSSTTQLREINSEIEECINMARRLSCAARLPATEIAQEVETDASAKRSEWVVL